MGLQRTTVTAPTNTSYNSLANSTTGVASSSSVTVGTSNNVVDHEVRVKLKGPATMTGSATTVVNIFAYASIDGMDWTGTDTTNELIDGTDKAITWSANGNQAVQLGSIAMTTTTSGTSINYTSKVFSIVQAFGSLPAKYVIVIQNQTGQALASSGHSIIAEELYY